MSTAEFVRRTLIVAAIAVALVLVAELGKVLVLVFGGIVLAVMIRAGGDLICRVIPFISPRWAAMLFVALIVFGFTALSWMVGDQVGEQFAQLRERLPEAVAKVRDWFGSNEVGRYVLQSFTGATDEGVSASEAVQTASATFGMLSHVLIIGLIAVYLAFSPTPYLNGAAALAPASLRPQVRHGFAVSGRALRGWLAGQLVAMVLVGLLTGLGLWAIGVPLAFILGILAGLLEFIPILGPFLAAIPGVLLAFSLGPTTALYAVLVYVIVQQLESAAIMPLAQKWSVELPPALGLFSIIVFGLLFGIPGVLFATPLTVVIMALVKRFGGEPNATA